MLSALVSDRSEAGGCSVPLQSSTSGKSQISEQFHILAGHSFPSNRAQNGSVTNQEGYFCRSVSVLGTDKICLCVNKSKPNQVLPTFLFKYTKELSVLTRSALTISVIK